MKDSGSEGLADRIGDFDFARMLSIADALPTPVALVDREGRYLFCNRALADFFELRRSQILGRHMREVLGESAYADRAPMLDSAVAGERQWFAATFDHPSRGQLAIETEYLPQLTSTGEVSGVVILVQDVTEQRLAERALRESEARFRRIANSAPVIMWVTRLDRKREFVNDAYLEFAGLAREMLEGHEWPEWVHPDDRERVVAESQKGEASLQPFTLEARYRRADGEWRWLRSVSSPRFGPDEEFTGFIGAAFDITPAKQSEEQLRKLVDERAAELGESEARLRAIFDSVREVVVLLDPDGTVLQLNRTRTNWREPDPSRAIGRKLWDAPTLQSYPQHRALLQEAIAVAATGREYCREIAMVREGRPSATLDVCLRPVAGKDGAVTFILFEARDITELKAAQEQLRQSQKMEALGQLTGGIAHDFNNLLTVVVGGLDMIVKRAEDPRLQRYARNALEAAERGARLTAQLLAFSRVQRLEVRPTYVTPLIENMRPLLRNVLGPGIEKDIRLDEHLMAVLADPTQLELAVLNLAINARDAMPDGGLLRIETRKVEISGDPELEPGDYLELAIADTGSGMSEEVIHRAFEPFFTTKEVGRGTGLGLSMVYGVARQSGGTARIESRVGEGTVVRLYFRRAETPVITNEATPLEGAEPATAGMTASVLIVDDDPEVREFMAATFGDSGFRVREASDGASALAEFRNDPADLVVLDFIMPGMTGAEVAKVIRAERPGQPILFVSGYSETDAIRAAAPGANVLAKPFRADALTAAARQALTCSPPPASD